MKRVIKHQDIYGMSRVGTINSKGTEFEIYVNTNDGGMIPHFHFRDRNDWNKFHTCIEIEQNKYFHHTGKEDVLNSAQRKLLQDFMTSPVQIKKYRDKVNNNWELICFMWDFNNSSMMIPVDAEQPDYTTIES
jgi:hypothetical protein